jgi:hypothetical protein
MLTAVVLKLDHRLKEGKDTARAIESLDLRSAREQSQTVFETDEFNSLKLDFPIYNIRV